MIRDTRSADDGRSRDIDLKAVFNLRDLGGYRTVGGRRVRWRRLFRGAGLQRLVEDDLEAVRELGWMTVVDLRTEPELVTNGVCPPGVAERTTMHLPIIHQVWPRELLDPAQPAEEFLRDRYGEMLQEGASAIRTIVETFADETNLPGAFYCAAGKDRTGVVAAILLAALGVDDATIARDYHLSKERVDRIRERARARSSSMTVQPEPFMQAPEGAMWLFLASLRERYGGAEGYLDSIGVAPATVAALRAVLLEDATD